MNKARLTATFLALLACVPVAALASGPSRAPAPAASHAPPKATSSAASSAAAAPDPTRYEFVVEKDKPLAGWEAMRIKGAAEDEGFITYEHVPETEVIVIHLVKGIKGQSGAGEALKREVLRRYPPKVVRSQLVSTNRDGLLEAWGKDFPHPPSMDALREQVPALKFEGFDYEITVKSGLIYLKMTPTSGAGMVTVVDPSALDAVFLLAHPKKEQKPASSGKAHR